MFKIPYQKKHYLNGMTWESFGVKTDWVMIIASIVLLVCVFVAGYIGVGL